MHLKVFNLSQDYWYNYQPGLAPKNNINYYIKGLNNSVIISRKKSWFSCPTFLEVSAIPTDESPGEFHEGAYWWVLIMVNSISTNKFTILWCDIRQVTSFSLAISSSTKCGYLTSQRCSKVWKIIKYYVSKVQFHLK